MFFLNRQGMSVVELMVGITITAVLATVTIPIYMTYVQQARVVSLVLPPLRLLETNVALFYSFNRQLPGSAELSEITEDINLAGLEVELNSGVVILRISAPDSDEKLYILDNSMLIASPVIGRGGISAWHLSGALADRLGLAH